MFNRILAVGLAVLVTSAGAVRAADPVEVWKGSWTNTQGGKSDDSTITFSGKGGDWDGFKITSRSDSGKTRKWQHYEQLQCEKGKFTYLVTATIDGDTMTVKYDVYDGVVLLGVDLGGTEKDPNYRYSGSGTYKRAK